MSRASESEDQWRRALDRVKTPSRGERAILGVNYSGMHDTAVALVSQAGAVLHAASLERVSRVKQDGRPLDRLVAGLPWNIVDRVAISTEERLDWSDVGESLLHPHRLERPRTFLPSHEPAFAAHLDRLPRPKTFVCHQQSHAASAFWLSGFEDALCLTYDGGMWNSPWFGGVFHANRAEGIVPLDRFSAAHHPKITSLYSVVTAILGFSPNRHEGKITGLAAFGQPSVRCRDVLDQLFTSDYLRMESSCDWVHVYSDTTTPLLSVDTAQLNDLRERFHDFQANEVAATLQQMTEEHVLEILRRTRELDWRSPRLCLAGGLFANVKLNQRIREFGFEQLFVAPAMTDDGTAVGAALDLASRRRRSECVVATDVFWGHEYSSEDIERALQTSGLRYARVVDPAEALVDALVAGQIVGVFQGRMEFGPRALGNRSVLCEATRASVHADLNARLRRTEFMPFAPITRSDDADAYYLGLAGAAHAAEFMTITCQCTDRMKSDTPAVVHVDGTARPQIVRAERHPLLYDVLTKYRERTGILALVNTSFNVHEEPIVCSPADAIRGFLEAGLDLLYFEGGIIVRGADNTDAAAAVLRKRLAEPTAKEQQLTALTDHLYRQTAVHLRELDEKERVIQDLLREVKQRRAADENSAQ